MFPEQDGEWSDGRVRVLPLVVQVRVLTEAEPHGHPLLSADLSLRSFASRLQPSSLRHLPHVGPDRPVLLLAPPPPAVEVVLGPWEVPRRQVVRAGLRPQGPVGTAAVRGLEQRPQREGQEEGEGDHWRAGGRCPEDACPSHCLPLASATPMLFQFESATAIQGGVFSLSLSPARSPTS